LLLAAICSLAGLAAAPDVRAASVSYKGITVTPAVVQIDLAKTQTAATFSIQVTNNTRSTQSLAVSSLDFRSLNDTGGLTFIGNDVNQLTNKHGLASWLVADPHPIVLAPGATKTATLSVENRADLAPGGHYAAVLFKADGDASKNAGTNQVSLNQVVSSLVFVRKLDGSNPKLSLTTVTHNGSLFSLPTTVNAVFQDDGNVQEVPRGLVTVTAPGRGEIMRGLVNTDSNLLLPDSSRLYQIPLHQSRGSWWPGVHHMLVEYRLDGSSEIQSAKVSFWYIQPVWIGVVAVLAVVGWYCWRQRGTVRRFLRNRRAAKVNKKARK